MQQAACVPLPEARTFLASLWAACAADGRPLLGGEGPWREDGPLAASLFGDRAIVAPAQRAWAIDALEGSAAPASPPPAAGRGWAKRDWRRFVAEERDGPMSPAGRHGQMKRAASRDLFPKYYPIHCPGPGRAPANVAPRPHGPTAVYASRRCPFPSCRDLLTDRSPTDRRRCGMRGAARPARAAARPLAPGIRFLTYTSTWFR